MLNSILNQIEFQWVDTFIQLVVAGAGWAAFILERQKSGGTTKVKLRMRVEFKQSYEDGKAVAKIELQVVNIGMATVYIETWGIELRGFGRKRRKILISDEMIRLEPGKPEKKSFYFPKKRIFQEALLKDRVYIYVTCRLGQIFYSKGNRYSEFEREYMKVQEPADSSNKEMEEIEKRV